MNATCEDPIVLALQEVHDAMAGHLLSRSLLLAYAREVAPGRSVSLRKLAAASGLSASGVRTAYQDEHVQEVVETLGQRLPADAEMAAMTALIDASDADRSAVYLQVVRRLDAPATARVCAWAASRFHIEPASVEDIDVVEVTSDNAATLGYDVPQRFRQPHLAVQVDRAFAMFVDTLDDAAAGAGYLAGQFLTLTEVPGLAGERRWKPGV